MTRQIRVGGVPIGGGAPVTIQSMTNTRTDDVSATAEQIKRLAAAGCEIVRVAVPDLPPPGRWGPRSGAPSLWWRTSISITGWPWSAWPPGATKCASIRATSAGRTG